MLERYLKLALLLVLVVVLRTVLVWLRPPQVEALPPPDNAEALLAYGRKIPLATAGIYELELLPGISYTRALGILEKRSLILEQARRLPPLQRTKALELVKGIGPRTAASLSNYLDLNPDELPEY